MVSVIIICQKIEDDERRTAMKSLVGRMVVEISRDVEVAVGKLEEFMEQLEDEYKGDFPVEIQIGSVRIATPFTVYGVDALNVMRERFGSGNVMCYYCSEDKATRYVLSSTKAD